MTETKIDQPIAYRQYFEIVKAFNSANKDYLGNASEITRRREEAIKQAIERHLSPIISTMKEFQVISGIAAFIALVSFFSGVSMNSNGNSQGWGYLLIAFALVLGLIAIIVFVWASGKITDINSQGQAAQQSPPPVVPNTSVGS